MVLSGISVAHIKIFIILIKLIFQNNIFNKICGIFLIFFGNMATFAVEVWSWKLCQIKDPLVFGAAIRGSVNQNIVLCCIELNHRTADCSIKGQWVVQNLPKNIFALKWFIPICIYCYYWSTNRNSFSYKRLCLLIWDC